MVEIAVSGLTVAVALLDSQEVVARLTEIGLQSNRLTVLCDRYVDSTLGMQGVTKVVVCLGSRA